jgi:signal transduction histidine kinase
MTLIGGSSGLTMTMEKGGRIWLYDGNHLFEFNPEKEQFFPYVESHGVNSVGAPNSYFHVSYDGEILIAGEKGFLSFYPDKIAVSKTPNPPDLAITSFRLLGKRILPGEESMLQDPIWHTNELILKYNQNIFAFSVTCFDYYDPAANQLEFMLEGYDNLGWRKDLREGETPGYVNVPPGEYILRVRGADSQGNRDEQGVGLKITVLPPWWKTWWAYSIYGMLFIGGVIVVDRVQRRRLLTKAREDAREKELEQAREIEKAYAGLEAAHENLKATQAQLIQSEKMASLGELTAGIAHEIQNPLNFVNNFSDVSKELMGELKAERSKVKGEKDEMLEWEILDDIDQNLEKIHHHGMRASEIVKSMLQHTRTGTGEKELTDINSLCDEYLRLAYHGMRARDKSFNAEYKLELDPDLPKIKVVPQDIGRVLLNLINNAFQAVAEVENPKATLITQQLNNSITIHVVDNGLGIPENIRDKIFQPFFTTKPTGQGTGLGLSLSYDIVKAHGGELKLETNVGQGCEFIIRLPR